MAKARQGGSFGDLLPDMVWEEKNVVKREKLEEEEGAEEKEAKKRMKTNDDGGDIKPITLDDVMFEEELYDRFSDEEDEHEEEETEKEINEQVLENKGDAEASIVDNNAEEAGYSDEVENFGDAGGKSHCCLPSDQNAEKHRRPPRPWRRTFALNFRD